MRRFPLAAAVLAVPLLFVGCEDGTDVDDPVDPVDPVETNVEVGTDAEVDGDATPVAGADSGSGVSAIDAPGYTPAAFANTVTFEIPGMHCEYTCAPEVEKTLAEMDGVDAESIETSVEDKTATFKVADGFDIEKAKAAVAAAGEKIGHDFAVANVN